MLNLNKDFDRDFQSLTGNLPFPWQQKLFGEFCDSRFRKTCPVPTGLGKTSTIAIWLIALAHHIHKGVLAGFPRRLVYVVNRRTVVDQATLEAKAMREALMINPELLGISTALQSLQCRGVDVPLAISTIRGQFADNGEWRDDPARPAVVIGTVDMIGSRLLFSGYGCGFKSRPLHAGFLGQDTLLVHDEAHLEPAFQNLIAAIKSEQQHCREFGRFHVMELTATSRSSSNSDDPLFTNADREDKEARNRIEAKKCIVWHPVDDEKKVADKIADLAKAHKDSRQAILVFIRELKNVEQVVATLRKADLSVETLTGTLRGQERDDLAKNNAVFARFMPKPETTPREGTVYLICTSAGEVGVNISADHLVCDLTPFDSMTQRFGRVNRFGRGDARIDIVPRNFDKKPGKETDESEGVEAETTASNQDDAAQDAVSKKKGDKPLTPYEKACVQTLSLMQRLSKREDGCLDASPVALGGLPPEERQAAFTPPPIIPSVSDILFDAWAMTSVRQKLPGRPPVVDWLHGIAEWEPAETYVAWREEVGLITPELAHKYPPEDLLEDYQLKPHELLRDRTTRVFSHLEKIATRHPDIFAWVVDPDGTVKVLSLSDLVAKNKQNKPVEDLSDCTVLLPPMAGGLKNGLLDGDSLFDETSSTPYDIADQWLDDKSKQRRCRVWDAQPIPDGMRLARTIDIWTGVEDEPEEETTKRRYWYWCVRPRSADDDGSLTAPAKQEFPQHLQTAEKFASQLVGKLGLNGPEAHAVMLAARWHDLGKNRAIWQRSIGNHDYPALVLAKSGPGMRPIDITRFRHEFGSLGEVSVLPEFLELPTDEQELVLHFIATHHGRARPHFPAEEAFDPKATEQKSENLAHEIPRRFARLQRKYGRWGLAYLESLVRAADVMASQAGTDIVEVKGGE